MRKILIFLLFVMGVAANAAVIRSNLEEKSMVVVIPSYNNKDWYERNLGSALSQRYPNFRVIYIDDASTDGTGDLVEKYIRNLRAEDRVTLIRNQERQGALANIYRAVLTCSPEEIIVTLDGDDWLAHEFVLEKLSRVYADPGVWITYGQFIYHPCGSSGWARQVPERVIQKNAIRSYDWVTTHLRTFYAGLFQQIQLKDLLYDNQFFSMAWDLAFMLPMMEMAGPHSRFIPDILYVYNVANQLNDHKVNLNLQMYYTSIIRAKKPYARLDSFMPARQEGDSPCSIRAKPPERIPEQWRDAFTLNGQIPVLEWYLDDSYSDGNPKFYSQDEINDGIEKVKQGEPGYYGDTDTWLYQALKTYPIKGKSVAIIGSANPWYESVVLAFGGHPVTIEYNKIITDDPRLHLMTVEEYEQNPIRFDVVLSISSTEHDGLGRYGDPVNPNGDLEFMTKVRTQMLKQGGTLILAVPFGQDCLVWNAHRIYGSRRFSLLISGWDIQEAFGFHPQAFNFRLGHQGYQPVFVLKPVCLIN